MNSAERASELTYQLDDNELTDEDKNKIVSEREDIIKEGIRLAKRRVSLFERYEQ